MRDFNDDPADIQHSLGDCEGMNIPGSVQVKIFCQQRKKHV